MIYPLSWKAGPPVNPAWARKTEISESLLRAGDSQSSGAAGVQTGGATFP